MSNISACLLGSAQNNKRQVINEIFENKYSLIYVTPELACGDYGHGKFTFLILYFFNILRPTKFRFIEKD